MDLDRSRLSEELRKGDSSCSICLECVVDGGERSIAKLHCGHLFHLDCIGSAFNAKGAMQCPNCRKVEKGQWLFANGYRSLSEFTADEFVNEDLYDLTYSELPIGFQWCPFRGFMRLSSSFDEGEPQPNAYHDLLGSAVFGDNSNSSSRRRLCPYLALHGFPHAMHTTASNSSDHVLDASSFHQHQQASNDVLNSHGFSASEQHHNWQQASLSASQLASRLFRNDSAVQQRGSFIHPFPFLHGSIARAGSNLVSSLIPPIVGDGRNHAHGHSGHTYQQPTSFSYLPNVPYAPIRRTRQRGEALVSSAGTNSTVENSSFYGFSVSSGSVNRTYHDGESTGSHINRFYGWVREGIAPLPWIPVDGEPWWWSPFQPNQNTQTGSTDSISRSYFPQRVNADRVAQGRMENNNAHRHLQLPRMSHFM